MMPESTSRHSTSEVTSPATCPECDGEGGWGRIVHAQVCGTIEDDEEREHFCATNCAVSDVVCSVCRGKGKIDGIHLAIYRARGGAAPTQIRGYA